MHGGLQTNRRGARGGIFSSGRHFLDLLENELVERAKRQLGTGRGNRAAKRGENDSGNETHGRSIEEIGDGATPPDYRQAPRLAFAREYVNQNSHAAFHENEWRGQRFCPARQSRRAISRCTREQIARSATGIAASAPMACSCSSVRGTAPISGCAITMPTAAKPRCAATARAVSRGSRTAPPVRWRKFPSKPRPA